MQIKSKGRVNELYKTNKETKKICFLEEHENRWSPEAAIYRKWEAEEKAFA